VQFDDGVVNGKKTRAARKKPQTPLPAVNGGGSAGKRRTRADPWTVEKLAELRAYRVTNGLAATVAQFGITRQRVCELLPGMGTPRGRPTKASRASGNAPAKRLNGPVSDFQRDMATPNQTGNAGGPDARTTP